MAFSNVFTDGSLEPRVNTTHLVDEADAILSIAISLKRIADVVEAVYNDAQKHAAKQEERK